MADGSYLKEVAVVGAEQADGEQHRGEAGYMHIRAVADQVDEHRRSVQHEHLICG